MAEQAQDDSMQGEGGLRGLAQQLAALREGMEGIRDHLDEIGDPPDYSEDFRAIEKVLAAVSGRMGAVETSSALSRTPEEYAELINEAADKVAAQPGEDVAKTAKALEDAAAALDGTISRQAYLGFWGRIFLFAAITISVMWIVAPALWDMFG